MGLGIIVSRPYGKVKDFLEEEYQVHGRARPRREVVHSFRYGARGRTKRDNGGIAIMNAPDSGRKLFRDQSLERLSSTEELERLMPVTRSVDWLLIAVTGALIAMVAIWSVAGRVPTVVNGRGIILRPRQTMVVQTTVAGRILDLKVRIGDHVSAGNVIAALDQSEIQKRIDGNRRAVISLEEQDRRKNAADANETSLQSRQDASERAGLETERSALRKNLTNAESLRPLLQTHVDSNRKLIRDNLLAPAAKDVADSESAVRDNEAKMSDYTTRLAQIEGQLQQIETRSATLARQILEGSAARRNEIDQLRRSVETDEYQIRQAGKIRSQYSGRVSELLASAGQVLPAGGGLLSLEVDDAEVGLLSISYFPVRDGKRIHAGMRIQVTPDTVERERFGGILGIVTSVSQAPVTKAGATTTIGNPELVQNLMPDGGYIEVRAQLEADPATASGYRWSSSRGPEMPITTGLTHSTRVTIDGRAPISYLLPILREQTGVY
jgi:HlyD family secretion protein